MIIYADRYGQLANRLFLFGHLIACSKENKTKLVFLHFEDYKHLFPNIDKERDFVLTFHSNFIVNKLLIYGFALINLFTKYLIKKSYFHINLYSKNSEIDLSNPSIKDVLQRKLVIINGWNARDRITFHKYSNEIKRIFKPLGTHNDNINRFITNLRSNYDFLVGVHIRLGDYKNWNNGKYYYPIDFYVKKCQELLEQLQHMNKKVVFVICSDEKINPKLLCDINFQFSTGHIIEDLYILSKCNIIFGPPSTFSMWASFSGNTPLLHIHDKNEGILLNKFKIHSEIIE